MANDISGGVWRIDTLPFQYNAPVKIVNLNWTDQVAVGDAMVIQTIPGKPIADSKANAVNYVQSFGYLGWVPSIKFVTLASGVIQISVGSGK